MTMRPQNIPKNRLPRGGNRCDFCAALFVYKLYASHNFEWDGRPVFSGHLTYGRWFACEQCSKLIEIYDWDRLTSRVMVQVRKRAGLAPSAATYLRRDLRLLYGTLHSNLIHSMTLTVHQPHYARVLITEGDLPNYSD
jgi:hypothetical protein